MPSQSWEIDVRYDCQPVQQFPALKPTTQHLPPKFHSLNTKLSTLLASDQQSQWSLVRCAWVAPLPNERKLPIESISSAVKREQFAQLWEDGCSSASCPCSNEVSELRCRNRGRPGRLRQYAVADGQDSKGRKGTEGIPYRLMKVFCRPENSVAKLGTEVEKVGKCRPQVYGNRSPF